MHIGIVSDTKLVSDGDISWMVRACELQLRKEFAPDWGIVPWPVIFYKKIEDLPHADEVRPIVITDSADNFETLGYHNYLAGADYFYGRVFTKPILDNGGGVLGGKRTNISDVLSHEVLEMRGNPYISDWVKGPVRTVDGKDYAFYAREACDAVQMSLYTLTPRLIWGASKDVSVSNYIRPRYFTLRGSAPATTQGPWDRMGILSGPFSIAEGGYIIVRNDINQRANVFGAVKPPAWLLAMKGQVGARTKVA